MAGEIDLIILTADADAEWTLRTLLEKRTKSIAIPAIHFEVVRHPNRDSGVYRDAPEFLRTYLGKARHALVLLDYHGSGAEHRESPQEIEEGLEDRINQAGWDREQIRVIVLEPELEVWVWAKSPNVSNALGMSASDLTAFLNQVDLDERGKPRDPKDAIERALRKSRKPLSPEIFRELAGSVSLKVRERSSDRFRERMQYWFHLEEKP
ncbi:MAG: hypothetical protein L6Q98_09500 [Anaerolineae bacterium]|nr:hypothetical protein [Anaerolineae bacterium]NUQ06930.1 hypothetical protein [Anaerolineae bacterium]